MDLKTGVRKWHFQFVHHGIWDFDMACAPILADITVNGRAIKAIAQPTKQALLYVFDRTNGQAGVADRRAAGREGRRAGEWYAPTQPFPLKARGNRSTIARACRLDDLIDFTPELRAEAQKLVSRYKIGPIFTPPVVSSWKVRWRRCTCRSTAAARSGPAAPTIRKPTSCYVYLAPRTRPLGLVKPDPAEERHELRPGNA